MKPSMIRHLAEEHMNGYCLMSIFTNFSKFLKKDNLASYKYLLFMFCFFYCLIKFKYLLILCWQYYSAFFLLLEAKEL
jgi:hypothetical protein